MARYKSQYTGEEIDESIGRAKAGGYFDIELDKKQDTLTFDEESIEDSTNPITSGAVFKSLSEKENKATYSLYTLSASSWSNSEYSFESEYPSATYNLEISVSENATYDEYQSFINAVIVGNSENNILKALGTIPETDIEVILKVTKK